MRSGALALTFNAVLLEVISIETSNMSLVLHIKAMLHTHFPVLQVSYNHEQ